jgi:hypothetical protein
MMTFQELQAEVQVKVIDLPTVITTSVPTLVNRAIRTLQKRHNYKVMEAEAAFTTTLQTRVLGAVPSDFKEFREVPYLVEDLGRVRIVNVAPTRRDALLFWNDDDEGYPRELLDALPDGTGARNFEVFPLPDGQSDYVDGEYRVRVPYWRYLPNLIQTSDTNWFTVNAEEFVIFKAVAEAFAIDWDEQRSAVWEAKAEVKRREVEKEDKVYRLSSLLAVPIHTSGVRGPRLSF